MGTNGVPYVVSNKSLARNLRESSTTMFGIEIWNESFLRWFKERNDLEAEIDVGWPY